MTWVTVQSHDIGDTFLGIYALERVFGVGGAGAICSWSQWQRRVVRVGVSSFWDQSQDRLQVVEALFCRRSQSSGGCFATAPPPRENARLLLANAFAPSAPGASALGTQKIEATVGKSFSPSQAHSGREYSGALAFGVQFGEEAQATGASRFQCCRGGEYGQQKAAIKCGRWTSRAGFARAITGVANR
jgi:hypothetical protein